MRHESKLLLIGSGPREQRRGRVLRGWWELRESVKWFRGAEERKLLWVGIVSAQRAEYMSSLPPKLKLFQEVRLLVCSLTCYVRTLEKVTQQQKW